MPNPLLTADARWLDAPTCEGWWWWKTSEETLMVKVFKKPGSEELWCDYGEHFFGIVAQLDGRWFGPLVPPEE